MLASTRPDTDSITRSHRTGLFGTHVRAFTVTNVTVIDCGLGLNYSSGNVMVQNGDHGSVSHSEMSGGSRGIWLERNSGLAVHHNCESFGTEIPEPPLLMVRSAAGIHDCGPLIDVDNGNSGVLLYSNVMENTLAYGMWLELNTADCYVFNSAPTAHLPVLHRLC